MTTPYGISANFSTIFIKTNFTPDRIFFRKRRMTWLLIPALFLMACQATTISDKKENKLPDSVKTPADTSNKETTTGQQVTIDTAAYNRGLNKLANGDSTGRWPVQTVYPLPGALLPFNRIVAFYGNLYSKRMGVLGEYPKDEMLAKLETEVDKWRKADPSTPVIPALHYIAVTAQGAAGKDGMHRLRMPFKEIDKIVEWSREIKGLAFIDIQVGHSTVQKEVPQLEPYLLMPDVHLGIDPEFSMKGGEVPGSKIGTFDAADVNYTIGYLSELVRKNNLPPKILIVHRFTKGMLTNADKIKPTPEVQVVIDMDGFGAKYLKLSTHKSYIFREPVQFTGFKLFYKNDVDKGRSDMFTPEDLMKLTPIPSYIQFQ